jgi:heme-degrading monooxygenase HmoA
MAVKIITQRTVSPDNQGELQLLLRQLRMQAINQPGYITGETLISVDSPYTYIVISTWDSLEDWKSWESKPDRREIQSKIEALLTTHSQMAVYEEQSTTPSDEPQGD